MNVSIKFATGLILAATALVASGSAALAGEGGAAGSVSIKFGTPTIITPAVVAVPASFGIAAVAGVPAVTSPNVDRLSTSVAVGKSFAVAGARTADDKTATFASGAGGGFTLGAANSATPIYGSTAETAANVPLDQINNFNGSGTATLAPTTGIVLP